MIDNNFAWNLAEFMQRQTKWNESLISAQVWICEFAGVNSLFRLEASLPPQLPTCSQTVFVRRLESAYVLFKNNKKKIHRDSSAELSVLSSLDTLKPSLSARHHTHTHVNTELRPVSLMVSCFCKHVSFWQIWHRYCYFARLSQECACHFSAVACFLDFFALLVSSIG